MAAALECWSGRASTDEDMVEQVLMRSQDRSEGGRTSSVSAAAFMPREPSSAMQKKLQWLSRNVSEAISTLKHTLNLDSARDSHSSPAPLHLQPNPNHPPPPPPPPRREICRRLVWGSVVRNLTQLYPGSQLPEKLVSNIRRHYDSLPLSYAQAGFDMEDVFLHIRLIEQASAEDRPAIFIQEVSADEVLGSVFKLTFVSNSSISWPAMSGALDNASMCCKKIQIYEKKGFTLGVVLLLVQSGQEKPFNSRIENVLKLASKKPKPTSMKLPFGLCGCQEQQEITKGREPGEIDDDRREQNRNGIENSDSRVQLQMPLPMSSFVLSVNEWQTIQSGGDKIMKWLLSSDNLEFIDQTGANTFKGVYRGKRVAIEKLRGCDKGNSYDFELRKDLLELMTSGHKNMLHFYGVCIDENHGLCVITKMMEGGSVYDMLLKSKRLQTKEILRISADVAEAIKFMHDHGVPYRDLNTQRILLDGHGNACLGDMGIVSVCKSVGDVVEYETDGFRWLAPEIIAADPENVRETWMSNVYSFGMVIWEMVTGEAAYASYSPVQAAVGIAACGLRPDIPKDCPQILKSLMIKCWNNCPSKRPQFSEILSMLAVVRQQL